jgi:hypothetical protein
VIALKIHHRTVYRFRQPVSLGAHSLMLRPRESRDITRFWTVLQPRLALGQSGSSASSSCRLSSPLDASPGYHRKTAIRSASGPSGSSPEGSAG